MYTDSHSFPPNRLLAASCEWGSISTTRALLDSGANCFATDALGKTPLHSTASNVYCRDYADRSLSRLFRNKNLALVWLREVEKRASRCSALLLHAAVAKIEEEEREHGREEGTYISEAVNCLQTCDKVCEEAPSSSSSSPSTAIAATASHLSPPKPSSLSLGLQRGRSMGNPLLECTDLDGNTALHIAARTGRHVVAAQLLLYSANINALNCSLQTPIAANKAALIENCETGRGVLGGEVRDARGWISQALSVFRGFADGGERSAQPRPTKSKQHDLQSRPITRVSTPYKQRGLELTARLLTVKGGILLEDSETDTRSIENHDQELGTAEHNKHPDEAGFYEDESRIESFKYWAEEEEYWQTRHKHWTEAWTTDGYRYFYRRHEDGAYESQWEIPEGNDRDEEEEEVDAATSTIGQASSSSSSTMVCEQEEDYEHGVEVFTLPRRTRSPHYNLGSWEGDEDMHKEQRLGANEHESLSAKLTSREKCKENTIMEKDLHVANCTELPYRGALEELGSSQDEHSKSKSKLKSSRSSKPGLLNVQLAIDEYHQRNKIIEAVSPTASSSWISRDGGNVQSPRLRGESGSDVATGRTIGCYDGRVPRSLTIHLCSNGDSFRYRSNRWFPRNCHIILAGQRELRHTYCPLSTLQTHDYNATQRRGTIWRYRCTRSR